MTNNSIMPDARGSLHQIFSDLDSRIDLLNKVRAETGGPKISRAQVKILGQMSLL